jgi:hypothetical protein
MTQRDQTQATPSQWLLGTWKSDKEATVAAWGDYPPGPPAFQAFLHKNLGLLTVRYTAKRSHSQGSDDWSAIAPYRVVWENRDSLLLVYGKKGDERGELLTFTSPSQYWVHVGRYWEFFAKQTPSSSVKGTSCGKPQAAPYLER